MESPPQPKILIQASSKPLVADDKYTCVNDWYALELRGGVSPHSNLWRVFHDSPPLDLRYNCGTTSALVGSDLYLITASPDQDYDSDSPARIRRLDTLNPAAGWSKSLDLPFAFSGCPPAVFVDGNSIYMFPIEPFSPLGEDEFYPFWGCIYDTIEQKGYPIRTPFHGDELASAISCSIWGFWKEHKVVVAPQFEKNQVFQYNIADRSWNIINGCPFSQFPNAEAQYTTTEPYTVMNGVLYLLDTKSWLLYAYDLRNGKHQVVELRLSEYLTPIISGVPRLVPLGDSQICFIWYADRSKGHYGEHGAILYATYSISLDPHFSATILDMSSFCFSGKIVNCMPFDSFRQGLHTTMTADDLYYYPRAWRNGVSKEWLKNKMQATPKVFGQLNNNMNLSGTKSISSLASSAPAAAYKSSILTPSALSQKYQTSMSRIPSPASLFTDFKGYLAARGTGLLKKCIKK